MSRKTKLTPELQADLLSVLSAGATARDACDYVGIHERTFYNWLTRGENAKSGVYFQFLQAVKKASASGKVEAIGVIRLAGKEQWQAAAWYLERRDPENWARRTKVELSLSGSALKSLQVLQQLTDKNGHDIAAIFEAMIRQYDTTDAG